jgi:hypothetical protein
MPYRRRPPEQQSWFGKVVGTLVLAVGSVALALVLYITIVRLSKRTDFLIPGESLHTAVAACLIGVTLALLLLPALMSGWSSTVRTFAFLTAASLVCVLASVQTGLIGDPATTSLKNVLPKNFLPQVRRLHSLGESATIARAGTLLLRVPNSQRYGSWRSIRESEALGRSSGRRARRAG